MSPVNVAYPNPPNTPSDWATNQGVWRTLGSQLSNNRSLVGQIEPLTIKAYYVFGNILGLCNCVDALVKYNPVSYMASYGLFAAGVEILGRCLTGNDTHRGGNDLLVGFKKLYDPKGTLGSSPSSVLTTTSSHNYTVEQLIYLRHYAAHGQANINPNHQTALNVDYEILDDMPEKIGNAIETYWAELINTGSLGEKHCENLCKANIKAFSGFPIETVVLHFQDGLSPGQLFYSFDWTVT